jgi:hypothetical protein
VAVRDRILRYRRQRIATAVAGVQMSRASLRDLARIVDAFDPVR